MKNNSLTLFPLLPLILLILPKPSFPQTLPQTQFPNPRLFNAYIALQAWKHAITADPLNFTSNWHGCHVCNYTGIYCAPAPDDPRTTTVAGVDLNHASLSGWLPPDLGLLTDLALFHLNSNHFTGTVPYTFSNLRHLYELDLSNNLFSGEFPQVFLSLPSLKFLDIRFNQFQGNVPSGLFDLKLDALFINNNNFQLALPTSLGNSTVSVLVLANNNFQSSCLPTGIGNMAGTLQEIVLTNAGLGGCLPDEVGLLTQLTVFDVSFNNLIGSLPESMGKMRGLEQLNVAGNRLSGKIPESICMLPRLENFTYSGNYFCGEPSSCLKLRNKDDSRNCIPYRPRQRIFLKINIRGCI
ncbi:leucine-rich repeat (LRR) family protein [Striga asiatica]|uniref:Cell wall hydroxyproline-rich glycoprotein n=1 Tax=Striga asiatica TaxID=4170 RepID=A0A5A7PDL6_STRAF|nr:leucine-rich repeat (LRR) family protein [Striga asiatica]